MACRSFFQFFLIGLLARSVRTHTISCGHGEVYSECASSCGEMTCDGISEKQCQPGCQPGCACDRTRGFFRDAVNRRCVLESDCPLARDCVQGEHFSACHEPCPDQMCPGHPNIQSCEYRPCTAGCICNTGLMRSYRTQCVNPTDCGPYTEPQEPQLPDLLPPA